MIKKINNTKLYFKMLNKKNKIYFILSITLIIIVIIGILIISFHIVPQQIKEMNQSKIEMKNKIIEDCKNNNVPIQYCVNKGYYNINIDFNKNNKKVK